MFNIRYVVASLVVVGGCGSKSSPSGVMPTSADSAGSGTPESVLPDSPTAADGAGDASDAYVQATFDARAAGVVKASCAAGKLRLTLDGVLFDFDHDNLQPSGDEVLLQVKQAAVDKYPSAHFMVEGHTDNVGSDAHNDDLSTRRAQTVVTWMQTHGVATERLAAKGYGKRWPRVPNTTDANRAKNRRVEFIVLDNTAAEACTKVPDAGGTIAGRSGTAPLGDGNDPSGGEQSGSSHYKGTPPPPTNPAQLVAFSFHYNDKTDARDHLCFSYDPAWQPAGMPPMGYVKKDYSEHDGAFVDHCPADNVVATCDHRGKLPKMEWYYQGMSEATLAVRKEQCGGKFVRLVAAPPSAASTADSHKYLGACDLRNAKDGNGRGTCVEYRDDANPGFFNIAKNACPFPIQPRCPSDGAKARCDMHGVITLYYAGVKDLAALKLGCEMQGGAYRQP